MIEVLKLEAGNLICHCTVQAHCIEPGFEATNGILLPVPRAVRDILRQSLGTTHLLSKQQRPLMTRRNPVIIKLSPFDCLDSPPLRRIPVEPIPDLEKHGDRPGDRRAQRRFVGCGWIYTLCVPTRAQAGTNELVPRQHPCRKVIVAGTYRVVPHLCRQPEAI